jgi:hypothetical protein
VRRSDTVGVPIGLTRAVIYWRAAGAIESSVPRENVGQFMPKLDICQLKISIMPTIGVPITATRRFAPAKFQECVSTPGKTSKLCKIILFSAGVSTPFFIDSKNSSELATTPGGQGWYVDVPPGIGTLAEAQAWAGWLGMHCWRSSRTAYSETTLRIVATTSLMARGWSPRSTPHQIRPGSAASRCARFDLTGIG